MFNTTRGETTMENFDQFVETVRKQLQPEVRANNTASTLEQLAQHTPADVTLEDLYVGWNKIANNAIDGEPAPVQKRRETCQDLAYAASVYMEYIGSMEHAASAWQAWTDAFRQSDDPRQAAMAATFARELAELQA